jgi:tetratricopeptide (TPR) repeat protein
MPVIMPIFLMIFIGRLIYKFLNKGVGSSNKASGSALLDTNRFTTLQQKYEKIALEYISQGQHQKAAHIYLKLLKNNIKAAQVLENGKCYAEAAAVYLNYCQNKLKAAECYEKGNVYNEALILYKELKNNEKAGDMYSLLNRKKDADSYYTMVANDYKENNQYVKASLICKNKIGNAAMAQDILLSGWTNNIDAFNCLNNYYTNIPDVKVLEQEINRIYKTTNTNKEVFLQVIKHEYTKHEVLRENIKDIAYEIIAEKLDTDPFIASELIFFNKNDKSITKDVMKFKASKKVARL